MKLCREPALIGVMAGNFASQQLAFAHLLDVADRAGQTIDLDHVEVIRGAGREARLAHYFDAATTSDICTALKDLDTCILLTVADALPHDDTNHLSWIGTFEGAMIRARPETPC